MQFIREDLFKVIKTKKLPKHEEMFALLVQAGRTIDDGLPRTNSGVGIFCFTVAQTEEEAMHETVRLLK